MLMKSVAAKRLTCGEARKVATEVARVETAAELRRLRREAGRVLASAERAMVAAGVEQLQAFAGGIGIAVPAELLLPGEGPRTSERAGRYMITTRTVVLQAWSVADWHLTRCGVGIVDLYRNSRKQRTFGEVAADIRSALECRQRLTASALAKLPRGATVADAVRLWPSLRGFVEKVVR